MERRRRRNKRIKSTLLALVLVICMCAESLAVFAQENVYEAEENDFVKAGFAEAGTEVLPEAEFADGVAFEAEDSDAVQVETDVPGESEVQQAEDQTAGQTDISAFDEATAAESGEATGAETTDGEAGISDDNSADSEATDGESMASDDKAGEELTGAEAGDAETIIEENEEGLNEEIIDSVDKDASAEEDEEGLPEPLGSSIKTFMVGCRAWVLSPDDKSQNPKPGQKTKYIVDNKKVAAISYKTENKKKFVYWTFKKSGVVNTSIKQTWKGGSAVQTNVYTNYVTKPVALSKVTINNLNSVYYMGSQVTWTYGQPDVGFTATWKSSNPKVATVDTNGTVRFLKTGTAKITGTYKESATLGGKATVTTTFKVVVPSLSKTCVVLKPGQSTTVTLKNVKDGSVVNWSNTGYDGYWEGTVSGDKNEKMTIKAYGNTYKGCCSTCTVTVDGMSFYLIVGREMTEYSTFSVNGGNSVVGKYDYKATAIFLDQAVRYRQANGLKPITNLGALGGGANTRVTEIPFRTEYWKRPDGSASSTAYGRSVSSQYEGLGPGGGKAAFESCLKEKYFAQSISSSSTTMIGVQFLQTKKSYPMRLGNKTKSFNRFIVAAFA